MRAFPVTYMAVYDSGSGLYQLQDTEGEGYVFVNEAGDTLGDYSDKSEFGFTYSGPKSECGNAGDGPGYPVFGRGRVDGDLCETYIFGFKGDDLTLKDGKTANLTMNWYNPGASTPTQYGWVVQEAFLYSVSNAAAYRRTQLDDPTTIPQVSLRFPVQLG